MSAHTPGPWRAVLSDEQQPQILYRGLVCVLERSPEQWTSVVAVSGEAGAGRNTIDANARLIAAAPEMYSLMQLLARVVSQAGLEPVDRNYRSILEQVDQVIDRIEGQPEQPTPEHPKLMERLLTELKDGQR